MKVSRRRVLEEALENFMHRQRCFSEGLRNQVPMKGYEEAFSMEREKAEVIRQIMREEGREPLPPMKDQYDEYICAECGMGFINMYPKWTFCPRCGREIKWRES